MICSYISGRLGNQFFEYAYARALQLSRGGKETLCFNFELVKSAGNVVQGFEDSLKYFNVNQYQVSEKNLVLKYGTLIQKLIYLVFQLCVRLHIKISWNRLFHKSGLLFFSYLEGPNLQNPRTSNVITYGKFENAKAFEFIKDTLLKEFTPRTPP